MKFKAHKLNLKIFSPVFESSLNEKKILVNCVSRIFHLNQEWIKDFLKNGEDLQIKEIENMHEQDEVLDNRENMVQNPQHDVIQG